jgi:hypothetical protein
MFSHYRILLRPGEVRVARAGGLLSRRGGGARAFAVQSARAGGDEPWRACVQRLAEALTEMNVQGASAHVVLSDQFARYLLVPWSAQLVTDDERIALARLAFVETFGPGADTWRVTMDEQPAGKPSFACAIDRALLPTLQDLAKALRLRIAAFAPALADRINRYRGGLKDPTFCLASLEPGRVTLAFRQAGAWKAVRSRRVEGPATDGLAGALTQEAAAAGVAGGGTLYLVGEDVAALPSFGIPGWKVERIDDGTASAASALNGEWGKVAPHG